MRIIKVYVGSLSITIILVVSVLSVASLVSFVSVSAQQGCVFSGIQASPLAYGYIYHPAYVTVTYTVFCSGGSPSWTIHAYLYTGVSQLIASGSPNVIMLGQMSQSYTSTILVPPITAWVGSTTYYILVTATNDRTGEIDAQTQYPLFTSPSFPAPTYIAPGNQYDPNFCILNPLEPVCYQYTQNYCVANPVSSTCNQFYQNYCYNMPSNPYCSQFLPQSIIPTPTPIVPIVTPPSTTQTSTSIITSTSVATTTQSIAEFVPSPVTTPVPTTPSVTQPSNNGTITEVLVILGLVSVILVCGMLLLKSRLSTPTQTYYSHSPLPARLPYSSTPFGSVSGQPMLRPQPTGYPGSFCPYCGMPAKGSTQYCRSCGAHL